MKHLELFEEYSQEDINEGWKDLVIGTTLVLSMLFPNISMSKDVALDNKGDIEYAITKDLLNREDVTKAIKKLLKNRFSHSPGGIPIDKHFIKNLSEGNYLIINTLAQTEAAASIQLTQLADLNRDGRIINKIYKMYKKTDKLSVEGIAIIKFRK